MTTSRRPFVPEDLYDMVLVGEPQIAPGGDVVAFVRSHFAGEKKQLQSHIWLAPTKAEADDPPARPFTRGPKSDSQPRWSPDGRRLAFVRQTGEGPRAERQIWIIDRDGGEAWPLTSVRHGAGNIVWSPDGTMIAFAAAVGDDESTEEAARPKTEADRKREKQVARDEAKLITRFRYKFDHAGLLPPRRTHVWVVTVPDVPPVPAAEPTTNTQAAAEAAATAEPRATGAPVPVRVTTAPFDHRPLDWSPDGQWLAVASSHEDERKQVSDVWLFPVPAVGGDATEAGATDADATDAGATKEPVKLTASDGVFSAARWSPAGDRLALIGHHREQRSATFARLWLYPAPGHEGSPVCLTQKWDQGIGAAINSDVRPGPGGSGLTWNEAGDALYFISEARGAASVYKLDVPRETGTAPDGLPEIVVGGPREVYGFSVSADEGKIAFAASTFTNPGDLFVTDTASAAERRLTAVNEPLLRHIELADVMEMEFTGADGLPLHGWIMKPLHFVEGARYPAVLQIHGGPHTGWGYAFSFEMQLQAAIGCAVIFANPRGSTGYGQQFATGCLNDYGGADYADLMGAVDHALSLGFIDENKLAVTGGSYGGFMTNWIVTQTNRFRAGISHRSISNWISFWGVSDIGPSFADGEFGVESLWSGFDELWKRSPLKYARNVETPLLLCHSEHDLRCPMEQAEQFYLALKWEGKTVELLRHPHSNHDLTRTGPAPLRVDRFHHIARFLRTHVLEQKDG